MFGCRDFHPPRSAWVEYPADHPGRGPIPGNGGRGGERTFAPVKDVYKAIYGCFRKWWVFPPNHPILIGFSIINHPFWGTIIFGNIYVYVHFFCWIRGPNLWLKIGITKNPPTFGTIFCCCLEAKHWKPIFRSLDTICFVSENVQGTNLQPF